jgi:hypothetical protein
MTDNIIDSEQLAIEIVKLVGSSLPSSNIDNIDGWIKSLHISMLSEIKNKERSIDDDCLSDDYIKASYSLGENFDCLAPMISDLEVERNNIVGQIEKYSDSRFTGIIRQHSRSSLGLASFLSFFAGKRLYRKLVTAKKLNSTYEMSPTIYTKMVTGFNFRLLELDCEIKKLTVMRDINTKKIENSRLKKAELDLLKSVITSFTKKRVSLINYLH